MKLESIKLQKELVHTLRVNKEKGTGIGIMKFVEQAVREKMKKEGIKVIEPKE